MALSTSLSVVTRSGLSSHHDYLLKDVLSVGVATFSNFKTGLSNLHSIGFDVVSNTGTGVTIRSTGNASFTGVITNEAHTVGKDNQGTEPWGGSGTSITVFKGTTALNATKIKTGITNNQAF